MPSHADTHPEYIDGCFMCRVSSVGYQGIVSRSGPDAKRIVPVVSDDGPARGKIGGHHTHHWDGRQDATVHANAATFAARNPEVN
jgi:hypothetical protein